jgi:glycyl-tRNA synthetase beta chain
MSEPQKAARPAQAERADFLLEIGVEELPATYVLPALEALERGVAADLGELRLAFRSLTGYAAPRRLAVLVRGLALTQPDAEEDALGPSAKAAYDAAGQPTPALLGFARGKGVDPAAVRRVTTEKGEYVMARVRHRGQPALAVLPALVERRVAALPFPKTMRWSQTAPAFRFARPVRWLVALLGKEVVPAAVAGLAAGRESRGHRFLAPRPLRIGAPARYAAQLERAGVVADHGRRQALLLDQARRVAQEAGGRLLEDAELAELNNFYVEQPAAALGRFAEAYLDLPREVVVTAMREHQRYFAVEDEAGHLLPRFVTILNGNQRNLAGIVRGNERVLRARLDDARYYWETDLARAPGERVADLAGIVWLEGQGHMLDKARRVEALAGWLAAAWAPAVEAHARRAALLMKTDLLGEMIGSGKEYASLEGVIGSYYAARHGEPPEVVAAIREHLRPKLAGDALPESPAGAVLAVADRLDSVTGYFLGGKVPSGSEDPYGVRRAANGVVRILLEQERHLSLAAATERALAAFGPRDGDGPAAQLAEFWKGRVAAALEERGFAYDEVATVAEAALGWSDPLDARQRATALAAHRREESFTVLVIGFKRVANILRAESDAPATATAAPGGAAWGHPAEAALAAALAEAEGRALPLYEAHDYAGVLEVLLGLRGAIDTFFTDVLINDPQDPAGRLRRLGLLNQVRALFGRGFDLSRIVVEG